MRTYQETVSHLGSPISSAATDDWNGGKLVVARWSRQGTSIVRSNADALRVVVELGHGSRLRFTQDDVDISIPRSAGDIAIVPPGSASKSTIAGPIDVMEVFVDAKSLGNFNEDWSNLRPRFNFADDDLRASAIGLFLASGDHPGRQSRAASARFEQSVLKLLGSSTPKGPEFRKGGLKPSTLRQINNMIDAHLHEPPSSPQSVAKLAEAACLSVNHFIRAFRETTGTTPYQYVMARRRGYAMALLRCPGISIAEVADRLGFSSTAHFITSFRQRFGATPGRYQDAIVDPAILGPRSPQSEIARAC